MFTSSLKDKTSSTNQPINHMCTKPPKQPKPLPSLQQTGLESFYFKDAVNCVQCSYITASYITSALLFLDLCTGWRHATVQSATCCLTEPFFFSRYLASMFSAMTVLYCMRRRETRCALGRFSLDFY